MGKSNMASKVAENLLKERNQRRIKKADCGQQQFADLHVVERNLTQRAG
jgi:hypothetical protein